MTNLIFGKALHIRGAAATRRSTPLRYARRDKTTIVTELINKSDQDNGVKHEADYSCQRMPNQERA